MIPVRTVGNTGLEVTVLGLGAAPIGGLEGDLGRARAVDIIRGALKSGSRLIDTAPMYGAGNSERRIGEALQGVRRDGVVISSKVGRLVNDRGELVPAYSRDGVLWSIEASLQRLRVERLDIVHIHDPDAHFDAALNEMLPVLCDLRSQGVIGAVGAGMNQWRMLQQFALHGGFDCFLLAGQYTLLRHGSLEFLELCQASGIAVILGSVFNTGILATGAVPGARFQWKEPTVQMVGRVRRMEATCRRFNVPLRTAALRFALAHPAVTSAVLGVRSAGEFHDHVGALATPLPTEFWDELRSVGGMDAAVPLPVDE